MLPSTVPTFFKHASFVLMWVSSDMTVSKWWQNLHFWVNCPFNISVSLMAMYFHTSPSHFRSPTHATVVQSGGAGIYLLHPEVTFTALEGDLLIGRGKTFGWSSVVFFHGGQSARTTAVVADIHGVCLNWHLTNATWQLSHTRAEDSGCPLISRFLLASSGWFDADWMCVWVCMCVRAYRTCSFENFSVVLISEWVKCKHRCTEAVLLTLDVAR